MMCGSIKRVWVAAILSAVALGTFPWWAMAQGTPDGWIIVDTAADPPVPPVSSANLEARMRARRDAQAATQAGVPFIVIDAAPASAPTGAFGGQNTGGGGGFGGRSGAGFGGGDARGRGFSGTTSDEFQVNLELRRLAPVYVGADPNQIETSGKIITQIIPLKYLDASRTRMDFNVSLPPEATVTTSAQANCIVITDTSAHVRHFVEILAALDKEAQARPPANRGRGPLPHVFNDMPQPAENGMLRQFAYLRTETVNVQAPCDGYVSDARNLANRVVKKGEVLVQLDTRVLEAHIAEDQARMDALRLAMAHLPATTAAEDAEARTLELSRLQAGLRARQLELESLSIRAPIDGELMYTQEANMPLHPGVYLARGALVGVLASQSDYFCTVKVLAEDARTLRVGQKFTFSTIGTVSLPGEITYIAPMAETMSFESSAGDKIIDRDVVFVRGKITGDTSALQRTNGNFGFSGQILIPLAPR